MPLLVGVISRIGLFAYRNVDYSDTLWWQFAWQGDAAHFLCATFAVAVVLATLMLNAKLYGQSICLNAEPVPDSVRRLTAVSGTAEAGISLIGDKQFIMTPDEQAYLA